MIRHTVAALVCLLGLTCLAVVVAMITLGVKLVLTGDGWLAVAGIACIVLGFGVVLRVVVPSVRDVATEVRTEVWSGR